MIKYLFIICIGCLLMQCSVQKNKAVENWSYPYPVKQLQLDDTLSIAYVEVGKGKETLLFVHGLGSNLKAWRENIEGLSSRYRCIAIDLPGYGKSSQRNYPFSMSFFARSVNDFVRKKGLKSPVLVGHSMGGQIALHATLSEPDTYQKLVLIAPAGFETFTEAERNWFATFYTPAVVKATSDEQIVRNFELNFYDMPPSANFMIEDRMSMKADSAAYDHYCRMIPQCVLGMLDEAVFARLPEIATPALVIYGQNDALIPNKILHPALSTEQVARAGSTQLPNSQLELVAEAGHFVNFEQFAKVNQLIAAFLDKD